MHEPRVPAPDALDEKGGPEAHERTEDGDPAPDPLLDDRLRFAWPLNPAVPITFHERP
ncbi:hypothetical protein [Streptomyces albireticuli]|uniref:hypothetical protein n=1 Tax=Streptomyces albireticuli TaxID=1940 RepID=UPI0036C97521